MVRTPRRLRVGLAAGLVTLSLTAFAGSVSAAPGPTPNGLTGACNMVMAWFPDYPERGMWNAMVRNNPAGDVTAGNGNAGMTRAVEQSGGSC